MRKLAIAAAAAGLSIGAATGASAGVIEATVMEPPPPIAGPYWTGFYVGAFAGGATMGSVRFRNILSEDGVAPHSWSASGGDSFFGGGALGFNWQYGCVVAGIEAQVARVDFNTVAPDPFDTVRPIEAAINLNGWEEFIGGRLGVVWGDALVYAKLGLLFSEHQLRAYDTRSVALAPIAQGDSTNATLAVGGGVEYALSRHWSAKLEYLYMNFDSEQFAGGLFYDRTGFPHLNVSDAWAADPGAVQTVRFGLNYRFTGWRDESPFK